jgi:cellulose synthase/poly-beta-1,6-N-acetylglucosamine synthase-like glycosyltransferase
MISVLQIVYMLSTLVLAVIGFNALILSVLYMRHRHEETPPPPPPSQWPTVVVQLPTYNERHVIDRLINAAAALDYPSDKLSIQLLDDSTDETLLRAAAAVEAAQARGTPIEHVLRSNREGFKAGALAYGLQKTDAEFVAIFDADFIPPPDFLKKTIPHLAQNPKLGLVQTRWAHLNDEASSLTRAQAIALDAHFVVEQTARHRAGLMMNFAGTGGVWRREAIQEAGGWHADTLSEDIDLSYRAQLKGWQFLYLPGEGVPGEIPPLMMGFKLQQSRWATGTIQCLRKLGGVVLGSHLTLWQKLQAMIHLGGYVIHPLILLVLLMTLPLVLLDGLQAASIAGLGLAMFGPPVQAVLSQSRLYEGWKQRLLYFPVFMMMGIGITVNNTDAVLRGLSNQPQDFKRTPKFRAGNGEAQWAKSTYMMGTDGSTWVELLFGVYAFVTGVVSLFNNIAVAPFMLLYAAGFFYVAGLSFAQQGNAKREGTHTKGLSLSETHTR